MDIGGAFEKIGIVPKEEKTTPPAEALDTFHAEEKIVVDKRVTDLVEFFK
jgi:hypothetical protein